MATTQNTYTGNGSTVLYSFTFPYLENTAIKVSLNGVITTAYTLANATTIQFTTAPANGAAIRIFRVTDDATLAATFYPGSSIRSQDLNENFTQNLYVTQESNRDATTATSTAEGAVTTANTALSNSTAATSTANTASANASAAVSTANTANSNASAAVSTANTASSNASAAVSTANAAAVDAATAISTANGAVSTANAATSTANTALSNSTAAVSTANTASSNASAAVSTANTASSNASTAVSTANSALSTANTALSNSSTAISTANAASAAVASAVIYQPVVDLTALGLLTPADGDFFELQDSTGADTDPDITGVPGGLVGAPGLTFRLRYDDPPQEFVFLGYFANDSETRYLKFSGGTMTGALVVPLASAATPSLTFTGDLDTGVFSPGANQLAVATNGTGRLFVDASGNVGVGGSATDVLSITRSANSAGGISIVNTNNAQANAISQLYIQGGDNAHAQLKFSVNSLDTSIRGQSDGSLAIIQGVNERMRLDSAGLVGIGTSSPSGNLHVYNPATTSADIYLENTDGYYNFKLNNQNLDIFEGATSRLRIASGGNVGIGTSSPNELLHVVNSGSNGGTIQIGSQAVDGGNSRLNLWGVESYVAFRHRNVGSGNDLAYVVGGPANFGTDNSSYLAFGTRTAANVLGERVRITSAGRVGIGTNNPQRLLHLASAGATYIRVEDTANTVRNEIFSASSGGWVGTQTNHSLNFQTNNTERARIDTSGRLLVGTSTAFSTSSNALIQAVNTSGGEIVIGRDFALGSGSTIGRLAFFTKPSAVAEAARIEAVADAVHSGGAPTRLVFSTTASGASTPTERMRISNGGQISQFSDTGWENIRASSASAAGTTRSFYIGYHSATGVNTGTLSYRVYTNGNVQNTNNSYGAISDLKLKENIVDANSQWDDLKALQVRNYNFKEGQTHTQIGLVAQEVELVSPGLVSESPDRDEDGNDLGTVTKSVNYSVLYMKAVKALQEAIGRIETLEAEVTALKA
jgi:hypothetical protein